MVKKTKKMRGGSGNGRVRPLGSGPPPKRKLAATRSLGSRNKGPAPSGAPPVSTRPRPGSISMATPSGLDLSKIQGTYIELGDLGASIQKEVHPFGNPKNSKTLSPSPSTLTSQSQYLNINPIKQPVSINSSEKSLYNYFTNGTQRATNVGPRLARINPAELGKMSSDDAKKYLEKKFTTNKAHEISDFFNKKLERITDTKERGRIISETLNRFAIVASSNTSKRNVNTKTKKTPAGIATNDIFAVRNAGTSQSLTQQARITALENIMKQKSKEESFTALTPRQKKTPENSYAVIKENMYNTLAFIPDKKMKNMVKIVMANQKTQKPPPLPSVKSLTNLINRNKGKTQTLTSVANVVVASAQAQKTAQKTAQRAAQKATINQISSLYSTANGNKGNQIYEDPSQFKVNLKSSKSYNSL